MRRLLPLLLVALVSMIGIIPAHADEGAPNAGWLLVPESIRLDSVVHAEHMFMDAGASTTYQWFADNVPLEGRTAWGLPITADLLDKRISAEAVITFPGHPPVKKTSAVSLPVLSRSLFLSVQAQTLDCTTGQRITPQVDVEKEGATLSYQWFLENEPLAGATSASLVLTADMVGRTPVLQVTSTLPPYLDSVQSASSNCPVLPSKVTPGRVRIVGNPAVGSEIYSEVSGWQPDGRVRYSWEWFVNGESIEAEVLTLRPEWFGKQVRVRVTGTGGAMQPAWVDSAPVTVLAGPFNEVPRPSVTGATTVGWVLSADSVPWSPQAKLSWQWRRIVPSGADVIIPGATTSSYRLTGADEGAKVYVVATGSATGRVTSSASSVPSALVAYNVYTTPGQRTVNGRQWRTTCEPYSQTSRCRTEIWATQVKISNQQFVKTTGWVFNNLTYLPSPRALWEGNNLGTEIGWYSNGRDWKTECENKATGKNACRSYIWTDFITSSQGAGGVWTYRQDAGWVFNNQVIFS